MYSLHPANGLGQNDPHRPYVTGGLGAAIYLVYISEIEPGQLVLKWYLGDPSAGSWSMLLGELSFDYDGPFISGTIGPLEVSPFDGDATDVWSVWVGDQLWSFSSASIRWQIDQSTLKWGLEGMQSTWSTSKAAIKWDVGEAF